MVGLPLVWVGNKSPANIVHAAVATDQLFMHHISIAQASKWSMKYVAFGAAAAISIEYAF